MVRVREKRNARLVGAAETSGELAEWRRIQWKDLSKRKSRLCRKEKSHQSKSPDREVGASEGEQEPHLGEKERAKERAWRKKG